VHCRSFLSLPILVCVYFGSQEAAPRVIQTQSAAKSLRDVAILQPPDVRICRSQAKQVVLLLDETNRLTFRPYNSGNLRARFRRKSQGCPPIKKQQWRTSSTHARTAVAVPADGGLVRLWGSCGDGSSPLLRIAFCRGWATKSGEYEQSSVVPPSKRCTPVT
jgi:hypothetical protein